VEHVSAGHHPDFRRLWSGLAISQIGSGIGQVALLPRQERAAPTSAPTTNPRPAPVAKSVDDAGAVA
jgi:hypothetical protein